MKETGFIINGKIYFNEETGRDEFHFYGFIVDGENQHKNFIWKVTTSVIYIFVKESKLEQYKKFFKPDESQVKFFQTNFQKEKCHKVFFDNKENLKSFVYNEPSLNLDDIQEYDVNFLSRFLTDNGIKGYVEFLESGELINDTVVFKDVLFQRKNDLSLPKLNMLSIDIETNHFSFDDFSSGQLYSVALYGNCWQEEKNQIFEKILMIGDSKNSHEKVEYFDNETSLLTKLTKWIQIYKPDIFIGWNVVNFDFKFLVAQYQKYNLLMNWGINELSIDYQEKKKFIEVAIPGRVIIEGIFLFKNFYSQNFDSYKLENVSQKVLSKGKTIDDDGSEKTQKIDDLFHHNKEELAVYNLQDTKLVYDLMQKTDLYKIELYRYLLTGTFIEKLSSHLDIIESLYTKVLHENKITSFKKENHEKTEINFKPQSFNSGFYKNVYCYSFKDFIVGVIQNYSIDPIAMKLARVDQKNVIFEEAIENINYHSEVSLLPKIFSQLQKKKSHFLKTHSSENEFFIKAIEQVIKNILQAMKLSYCRFSLYGIYESILKNQKYILDETVFLLNREGFNIIAYDLDCVYISFQENNNQLIDNEINKVSDIVNGYWNDHFQKKNRKNYLHFCKKNNYNDFFLYQQQMTFKEEEQLKYSGFVKSNNELEFVDSTKKKRNELKIITTFSQFLLENIFNQISVSELENKVIQWKKKIQNGDFNDQLILVKKITRNKIDQEYQHLIDQYRSYYNHFPSLIFFTVVDGSQKKYQLAEKNKLISNDEKLDYEYYLNKYILVVAKKVLINSEYEKCLQHIDPKNKGQISLF